MKAGAATPADMVAELDIEDRLEAAEQTLERERMALEQAKAKQEVLEKYTSKKTTDELKVEVEHKRSDELAKLAAWQLEKSKEAKIRKQIENCKIYASFDGHVVLANDPNRNTGGPQIEAGATVRERQKIFSSAGSQRPDAGEHQGARVAGRPDHAGPAGQGSWSMRSRSRN